MQLERINFQSVIFFLHFENVHFVSDRNNQKKNVFVKVLLQISQSAYKLRKPHKFGAFYEKTLTQKLSQNFFFNNVISPYFQKCVQQIGENYLLRSL